MSEKIRVKTTDNIDIVLKKCKEMARTGINIVLLEPASAPESPNGCREIEQIEKFTDYFTRNGDAKLLFDDITGGRAIEMLKY